MVTTNANDQVAEVHPKKRMPVILPDEEAVRLWMSPDVTERAPLERLFRPFSDEAMQWCEAS